MSGYWYCPGTGQHTVQHENIVNVKILVELGKKKVKKLKKDMPGPGFESELLRTQRSVLTRAEKAYKRPGPNH